MRVGLIALLIVVVVAAVVALNSFFIINPTQQALVTQFGEVRQAIRQPGLNAKIPIVQDVLFLDKRVLDLNVPAQEIIAADQKRLVVDAFMRYRIANPVRFYQTVNNVREGATRLSTFAQSSLRAVLADATFQDIVRDDRPDLMLRIRDDVAARARDIGVEVVDMRIRRADLPEANSEAIFNRMTTERQQEATQIRAQGREAAQRLRAAADRTATVLRAEADRESEQVRGEGDGQANAIFARAYTQDPQFFAFFRAMQAYEASMETDTRLVLSPQSDFFRYFNDPFGSGERQANEEAPGAGGGALVVPDGVEPAPEGAEALAPETDEPSASEPQEENADEAASLSLPDAAAAETSPVEASLPGGSAETAAGQQETGAAEAATGQEEAGADEAAAGQEEAGADEAAATQEEAAELPAENVAIDPSAEPGRITIVRPDQKLE